jgi:enolase
MVKITKVFAREVLDSRGNPTVEATVEAQEYSGVACAPSGASKGSHEALEVRDGGKRFGGKGVQKAIANVNGIIAQKLAGMDAEDNEAVDRAMCELDGTANKTRLGGNATTAVSLAAAKCAAAAKGVEFYESMGGEVLPVPMMNVLNGGRHAGNGLAIQEFMVMPYGVKSFAEAVRAGSEIYHALSEILVKKYGKTARNVGDEGGFAPPISNSTEALNALEKAIEETGYKNSVGMALDAAASEFYDGKKYSIDGQKMNAGGLSDYYSSLCKAYDIQSLEDPFFEESFSEFAMLQKKIGKRVQVVGDDLIVTNEERLALAIEKKAIGALLVKVNQIGTLSEAMRAVGMCKEANLGAVVSHRSGETEDTSIADIAVGCGCGQIKTGSLARGERTAKYNRLMWIERTLGGKGLYAGKRFRKPW